MYTKVIIDNLLPSLKQCVIYVGINSYMEADNASAILINDNDFDEAKLFISTEQPLVISNSTGYEKLCILLECGRNVVTSGDIKTIEKVLVHELMHVYNDVKHSVMSIHTGAAYYFADLLCNAVQEQEYGIPTPEDIIGNKVSDIEMYAALMYYCDPSELNAFKQTYQVEAVYTVSYRRFRQHNVPEKSEMLKLFKTETYRVYESLYKFLIMHMEFCSNIISNQNIRSILLQYYKETDIKHPKQLPMFWKSRIQKQLNDCKTIFHDICEEEY